MNTPEDLLAFRSRRTTIYRAAVIAWLETDGLMDSEDYLSLCQALQKADEEEFRAALHYVRALKMDVGGDILIRAYSPNAIRTLEEKIAEGETQ